MIRIYIQTFFYCSKHVEQKKVKFNVMLNESLRGQLDELRAAYDSNTAPGGINLWWGGSTSPDGEKDTPALDQTAFQSFYGYLEASSARPGQVLPWRSINAAVRPREHASGVAGVGAREW